VRILWAQEQLQHYLSCIQAQAGSILLAAVIGAALGLLCRLQSPRLRWLPTLLVVVALGFGLWRAVAQASLLDDAYITLRYAKNLLNGDGLVWNPGERVEGYTNFLWLLILAAGSWLSGAELPLVALVACLVAYVGSILAMARLESRLFGAGLPIATLLLALQNSNVDYATSGLETGFSTLCVLLGLHHLTRAAPTPAGVWFILGTLCRPDLGIFWVAGGLTLLVREGRSPGMPVRVLRYAVTFLPYALALAWRYAYYGSLVPNTYYAKSANLWYLEQGAIYALSFLLGAHLWLLTPWILRGIVRPGPDAGRRILATFGALAIPAYSFYVLKVGGDFMYGRFFVVLLPLLLLLARAGIADLSGKRGAIATALLACTLGGVPMIPKPGTWYLTDEVRIYPVVQWWPRVEVDHHNWRSGTDLYSHLSSRGIRPVIATSGIGMVGYYSELEVVDLVGLTDARVARTHLKKRGMPGHEKRPPPGYLEERKVDLVRSPEYHPARWHAATAIFLGPEAVSTQWLFLTYNADLIAQIQATAPDVEVTRIEPVIDQWLAGRRPQDRATLEEDATFFEKYYFCCNDDPTRKAAVAGTLAAATP
jgi:hypothetical protein